MALSDIYSQQPYVPYNDNRIREGLAQLPGVEADMRQHRPVTAWEKAVMRLMAGHDPKAVAADTKQQLAMEGDTSAPQQAGAPGSAAGGMAAQSLGSMGAPPPPRAAAMGYNVQPPQVPQAMPQGPTSMDGSPMRQPVSQSQRPMPNAMYNLTGNASGVPSSGGISDDTFNGMQHADYQDFVSGMHQASNVRVNKSQSDLMALEQEKTRRAFGVEDKRGKTAVDVKRLELDKEGIRQDREDVRAELDRRIKKGILDEKIADDVADNQLGYAKLQEYKKNFRMAHSQNERLKWAEIMYRHADNLASSSAKIDSSLFGRAGAANADIKSTIESDQKESIESRDAAKAYMDKFANGGGETSMNEGEGDIQLRPRGVGQPRGVATPVAPKAAAPKKVATVGQTFKIGDKTYKVNKVDEQGRVAGYDEVQ